MKFSWKVFEALYKSSLFIKKRKKKERKKNMKIPNLDT